VPQRAELKIRILFHSRMFHCCAVLSPGLEAFWQRHNIARQWKKSINCL
jgi:hypothetical protein